jgi:bacterial/archaeal transporter family-2 protein
VGALVVIQSRANGGLAVATGDGLLAAVLSFVVGAVILAVIAGVRPVTRAALTVGLPRELRAGRLRWWHLLGGLGGALYVSGQGIAVPLLGVAMFTVVTVAGTTGTSLGVDRSGLGPGRRRPVTARRVVAAVGATCAVGLAVSGRADESRGSASLAAIVLSFVAGAAVAVQPALNGQVAARTGDPFTATIVNFTAGLSALVVALGVEHLLGHAWTAPPAPWVEPWLWLGGPVGVAFIASASVVVKPLGVLLFGLVSIAGQLCASVVSDLAFPTPGTVLSWQLLAGVALTLASVLLAAVQPGRRMDIDDTAPRS